MASKKEKAEAVVEFAKLILSTGLDLKRRRMILGLAAPTEHNPDNDVSWGLFANIAAGLDILEHHYVPTPEMPKVDRIEILLTTFGGDLYTSFGIYDRIKMSSVPVDIHVVGPCMSGGSIILQAGARRFISRHSRLMLHYGFTGDWGTSNPMRIGEETREHNMLMDQMVNIYLNRCNKEALATDKITREKDRLKKLFPNIEQSMCEVNITALAENMFREEILPIESYLDPETCLKYGLVDGILDSSILPPAEPILSEN